MHMAGDPAPKEDKHYDLRGKVLQLGPPSGETDGGAPSLNSVIQQLCRNFLTTKLCDFLPILPARMRSPFMQKP